MSSIDGERSPDSSTGEKSYAAKEEEEGPANAGVSKEGRSGRKQEEAGQTGPTDLPSDCQSLPRARSQTNDSQVYTATSRTLFPGQKKSSGVKTHHLTLEWAFGMNPALPVFSLQDQDQHVILFGCDHVAVIHNLTSNSQHILQGHNNPVSCLCVSEDRRWLVTADRGPETLVIIWDSYSGIPVRTLFNGPQEGSAALALSTNSKLLVAVGAGEIQRVYIWDWTSETESPLCVRELEPKYGFQHHVIFHPTDSNQLLSTSESNVIFYTMDKGELECSAPEILDKTFNMVVGSLSQSVFHLDGLQACSATSAGRLVIWDVVCRSTARRPLSRKAIKLIPIQEDGITVLTLTQRFIVTGDVRGHVKFYDEFFKLVSWYSEFGLDPIISISFSNDISSDSMVGYPKDCTPEANPLVIQNFVLSTASATVVHVNAQGMLQTLMREHSKPLHAVACHPSQPIVAMGSHCGILKIWNYQLKKYICSRVFGKEMLIQCIAFDPQGFYLAAGFANGSVHILDALTLMTEGIECFKYSKECITQITFSQDSHYLATADTGNAVTVFRLCCEDNQKVWRYQGRHRSHYKPIQDILFGVFLDSTHPRLLSLGMDRVLVEYDLKNCGKGELQILSMEHIEQSAVPTCMAWYPPLTTEDFLLTVSNSYKMKLFNSTTKMCRKTLLGPTYDSPVKKIAILPVSNEGDPNSRYLAYITTDKVGLQILPMDGNPYKSSALLCHSTGVSTFACSYDGKYIFTTGGPDCTVFSWETSLNALEAAASLGGQDLIPFYSLLDGGREGELFREMEDYFYYSQLRTQGIDSKDTRQLSTRIPLTEVPFIMRALGFFPTEQELEDMQNEVKFSRYAETEKYVTEISLEEFIKLYVNHRPAFGMTRNEIQHIFEVLGNLNENGELSISRDELLQLLQARGEHMTEEELAECFSTLLGINPEGGRSELVTFECQDSGAQLECEIPAEITMDTLTVDILGFSVFTKNPIPPDEEISLAEHELS